MAKSLILTVVLVLLVVGVLVPPSNEEVFTAAAYDFLGCGEIMEIAASPLIDEDPLFGGVVKRGVGVARLNGRIQAISFNSRTLQVGDQVAIFEDSPELLLVVPSAGCQD